MFYAKFISILNVLILDYLIIMFYCSHRTDNSNKFLVFMYKKLAISTLVLGSALLISSSASAVGITNLASFDGTNGSGPIGGLTYDGTTNLFYGLWYYS